MKDYFAKSTVWKEGDELPPPTAPLAGDNPPLDPDWQPEPPRVWPAWLPWWAVLWYAGFAGMIAGALFSIIRGRDYALFGATPLEACIGITMGIAMWGITLFVAAAAHRRYHD